MTMPFCNLFMERPSYLTLCVTLCVCVCWGCCEVCTMRRELTVCFMEPKNCICRSRSY